MDVNQFDRLARSLATGASRRRILGRLIATIGLVAPSGFGTVEARKKRKRKRKKKAKLAVNAFGCVDVGGKCRGNSANCCSGICQGKKPKQGERDKSRCVAHGVGGCQADQDACVDEANPGLCGTNGVCFRTTGNASFCGNPDGGECAVCAKDVDCEAEFGPGAACIACPECSDGTVCIAAAA